MSEKIKAISWSRRLIQRTAKWARRRHAPDQVPGKISSRRIYIIPSRFGIAYAIAVFVLLLGAMNYSNSLAFFLTFMLTAVGFVAMHLTHSNLSGLMVEPALAEPVFAGEPAVLKVHLWHEGIALHPEIEISNPLAVSSHSNVNVASDGTHARLVIETSQRGYAGLEHINLATRFPLKLFYAWSVIFQDLRCLVYPTPADEAPEAFGDTSQEYSKKTSRRLGQDDFAGLRDYQWQDSPQHIAWKHFASKDQLLVKQFHESVAKTLWLDFDALTDRNVEVRLSQLCRLIINADKNRQTYGLKLGEVLIPPGHGEQHKHQCLRALALYQMVDPDNGVQT